MNVTIAIAQVLGIILTVVGLSMLVNKRGIVLFIEDITQNRGCLWLGGFISLSIGAIIVSFNNVWGSGLQLLVAIIGWLALLKGLFILLLPGTVATFYRKANKPSIFIFGGLIVLIVGLLLLSKGFL